MPIYMQVDGIKSVTLKSTGAVGFMLGDGSVRHLFGPKQALGGYTDVEWGKELG